MARGFAVSCFLFAGVWLLTSLGWALVAGGALALIFWPARGADDWVTAAFTRTAAAGRRWTTRVKAAPRRTTAVGGMTAGLVLAPAGFGVTLGPGVALIAAGVALAAVALLTGWNT